MPSLTFLGATEQVTGSCYMIEFEEQRIILECGIIQGESDTNSDNFTVPFDVENVDAVIISHAHLDHSGRLGLLASAGYQGPVYVTRATNSLLPIMLKDAAFLHQKDIEWENKHLRRAGKTLLEPSYTVDDVDQILGQTKALPYGEQKQILPGIKLRFMDAGHIIGSSIVEIWFETQGFSRKLVFSGDLGNSCSPLLPDPDIVENADLLLLESTYGDRDHRPLDETLQEFEDALRTAAEEGGNVLIPSFAVGRTQDLIYRLGQLYQAGRLKQQKVFIDSPMATKVTKVYKDYTHLFNEDDPDFSKAIKEGWENWLPIMSFTQDVEESMALNNITSGAIIIAGSGMCTGGRIRHHLKYNLWREKAHILIVGFQARGTLGRLLVDGARQVRILGSDIAVKAQIHTLGGFSAHAGQSQLITWAGRFKKPRPRLYLVHGEREKMEALRIAFHQQLDWEAHLANFRETITF
jgi:metallo-beta-lactamase family protein